jgi:DNA-binding transcriptional LysR family regulator
VSFGALHLGRALFGFLARHPQIELTLELDDVPLRERTLRVLDVGAEGEGATVHIAYPEHLRTSGKIRALTAWLREAFGEPAYWDDASR